MDQSNIFDTAKEPMFTEKQAKRIAKAVKKLKKQKRQQERSK